MCVIHAAAQIKRPKPSSHARIIVAALTLWPTFEEVIERVERVCIPRPQF
jgi:hypothetical protein